VERAPNYAVALSVDPDPIAAAIEVSAVARAALGGAAPTLAVIFASPHAAQDPWSLLDAIHEHLAPEHLIGCTGETIIGDGREIEEGPALSLWCARMPDVSISTFRLVAEPVDDGYDILGWPDALAGGPPYRSFNKEMADRCLSLASSLIEFVTKSIES